MLLFNLSSQKAKHDPLTCVASPQVKNTVKYTPLHLSTQYKLQNNRLQNSTYPIVPICNYSVSAEYSVSYSAEYYGRNRFRSDSIHYMIGLEVNQEIFAIHMKMQALLTW